MGSLAVGVAAVIGFSLASDDLYNRARATLNANMVAAQLVEEFIASNDMLNAAGAGPATLSLNHVGEIPLNDADKFYEVSYTVSEDDPVSGMLKVNFEMKWNVNGRSYSANKVVIKKSSPQVTDMEADGALPTYDLPAVTPPTLNPPADIENVIILAPQVTSPASSGPTNL